MFVASFLSVLNVVPEVVASGKAVLSAHIRQNLHLTMVLFVWIVTYTILVHYFKI